MSTTTCEDRTRIEALVDEILPDLVAIRHDLHAHPELMYEEQRTCEVVQRELERAGVDFARNLAGGTGVLGHLPGNAEHAVGLRADMDALPITEETGVPYTSTVPGCMHACGHDGHTTILIGAARVLARLAEADALPHPVSFVFQPAEEGGAGGRRMVEDGCLSGNVLGPPVARMFGLHGWPRVELGEVGTRVGPLLAAADEFRIVVRGTGCHAAFPHVGHDPVVAASAIVMALQTVASRAVDPLDSIVVSTTMVSGGTAFNVIPDEVRLSGTVRTLRAETQEHAIARMGTIAERTAEAHGCTATLEYTLGYPVTENAAEAVEAFRGAASRTIGAAQVLDLPQPVMGGEDFAFYCREVPSCFFVLGLHPPDAPPTPDLHQPTFDFNDDAIATGVRIFCELALSGGR